MSEKLTNMIIDVFTQMQNEGRWLESGEIELLNGIRFSYKLRQLKSKPQITKSTEGNETND